MVVNYIYDAWGNHAVVDASGNDITDTGHIGNVNPFRYRGYYYDTETGLYYLQTRYYDPELGRFISQDSVDYADPEKINGLNLYAYCANNPVMNVDPTGEIAISIIIGIIIGAIIGGTAAYSIAKNNGATGWELVGWTALGVVLGGFIGGLLGYAAPSLSSFMNAPIPLFSYATASGTAVVVSATGAQIIAGTVAVAALGGNILYSRIGKSGGYKIDHHYPSDHKPFHVHISGDDGVTRVDLDGNPIQGDRQMTVGERKAFFRLLNKIINALKPWMK